jgi:hypothetical protein
VEAQEAGGVIMSLDKKRAPVHLGYLLRRLSECLPSDVEEFVVPTINAIGGEFRKLPNFVRDRKEKCDELKPTDADAGRDARSFFSARWNSGRRFSGSSTVRSTT